MTKVVYKQGATIIIPARFKSVSTGLPINVAGDQITSACKRKSEIFSMTTDMTNASTGIVIFTRAGLDEIGTYRCDIKRISNGVVAYSKTFDIEIVEAQTP